MLKEKLRTHFVDMSQTFFECRKIFAAVGFERFVQLIFKPDFIFAATFFMLLQFQTKNHG